jgi:hypothetical protein
MIDDPRALAARLLAASPFAMSLEDALNQKRARQAALLSAPATVQKAESDFTAPEPMPVLDRPDEFASAFLAKRRPPGPDDEPPKPKSKRPRGKPRGRFEVFDGGVDKDK